MAKVAVLVAAYNAKKTVVAAIESVLSTSVDCKVFVVDDCSERPIENSLRHYLDRVTIIRLEKNVGPAKARNAALKTILDEDFDYVAIMDADDISTPQRLEKQAAFLDNNPNVGAVGSWIREFHDTTRATIRILARPSEPELVRNLMFFNNAVPHASAMLRVDALKRVGMYLPKYPAAEGYEMLRRIGCYYDLANLPEYLVHYRISPNGISQSRRTQQLQDRLRIQMKYFEVGKWQAWAGVLQTIGIMFLPQDFFQLVKTKLSSRQAGTLRAKLIGQ